MPAAVSDLPLPAAAADHPVPAAADHPPASAAPRHRLAPAGGPDKLQPAAYSAPEIAPVTPFSNSATICSLPRFLAANALPPGWDLDRFARLVEERPPPAWPRLPTGVGVCLYVKRKA